MHYFFVKSEAKKTLVEAILKDWTTVIQYEVRKLIRLIMGFAKALNVARTNEI